ncbi:MAG: hypothetical protein V1735_01165 [Nanoarchaeota archaeon]
MKKIAISMFILSILVLAGCQKNNEQIKEPDSLGIVTETFKQYVSRDQTQCAASMWVCIEGTQQFYDEIGCGCEPIEPRKVISDDSEKCKLIRYQCIKNYVPYNDESGCGCQFDWATVDEAEKFVVNQDSDTGGLRQYISRNQTQCAASTWVCTEGTQQFYDETGCGCEQKTSAAT